MHRSFAAPTSTNYIAAIAFTCLLAVVPCARAQWRMQASGTHAGLRGIHAVSGTIAWASGTGGAVLRTIDGGQHWQTCSLPPGAAKLDFRSVWAWDAEHAMVMSSGPGQQSRLYSTHDACRTWRLVFTNPDAEGFWDALQFDGVRFGAILGDPVGGSFVLLTTYDGGVHWTRQVDPCLKILAPQQGAFAASNQSLVVLPMDDANAQPGFEANHRIWFGTSGGWLYELQLAPLRLVEDFRKTCGNPRILVDSETVGSAAAGIFALAFHNGEGVAVGGNYVKPQETTATAAYAPDGIHWQLASRPPAGYRSTVAWNNMDGIWIAAGPNGTDVSSDGGKTWRSQDPKTGNNGNWNAISLPFAVGPDGRIARLISWGQLRVFNEAPLQSFVRGKD